MAPNLASEHEWNDYQKILIIVRLLHNPHVGAPPLRQIMCKNQCHLICKITARAHTTPAAQPAATAALNGGRARNV